MSLPYGQGVTEALQRLFRIHNITPHIKHQNSLRSLLVAPKDPKDKLDRSGAVYGLKCGDCSASYVGENARPLRARIREHKRPSSPVGEHAINKGHTIDWDNVSVLDRENDWFRRGVREAIHIKRTNYTLNKDQGRHNLPSCYDKVILSSCDRTATSGHTTE